MEGVIVSREIDEGRRDVLRWISVIIVMSAFGNVLTACRKLGEFDRKKKRRPPSYDLRTPLGAMQARGFAITPGAYTDPMASGTYVIAVNGTSVERYAVDGYGPPVSADTFRLDQFGPWKRIEWYRGGVVVAMIAA